MMTITMARTNMTTTETAITANITSGRTTTNTTTTTTTYATTKNSQLTYCNILACVFYTRAEGPLLETEQ